MIDLTLPSLTAQAQDQVLHCDSKLYLIPAVSSAGLQDLALAAITNYVPGTPLALFVDQANSERFGDTQSIRRAP
jgi:hypothetical protein